MSSTELARKPANVMRAYTQQVRDHSSAMQRLQDQYFAALERASSQYFEGVKRVTEAAIGQPPEPVSDTPMAEASSPTQ
jgi:hypothetical protein